MIKIAVAHNSYLQSRLCGIKQMEKKKANTSTPVTFKYCSNWRKSVLFWSAAGEIWGKGHAKLTTQLRKYNSGREDIVGKDSTVGP